MSRHFSSGFSSSIFRVDLFHKTLYSLLVFLSRNFLPKPLGCPDKKRGKWPAARGWNAGVGRFWWLPGRTLLITYLESMIISFWKSGLAIFSFWCKLKIVISSINIYDISSYLKKISCAKNLSVTVVSLEGPFFLGGVSGEPHLTLLSSLFWSEMAGSKKKKLDLWLQISRFWRNWDLPSGTLCYVAMRFFWTLKLLQQKLLMKNSLVSIRFIVS